jgi:hypothetical protein
MTRGAGRPPRSQEIGRDLGHGFAARPLIENVSFPRLEHWKIETQDLNDLFAFAKVVEHTGFSAAARVLHVTKSSLSKRVARLEDQ